MNGKQLLKALRVGTVPQYGIEEILVGHENQIEELLQEIAEIKEKQSSAIRFIQGEYGSGKTMLTAYLMEKALNMNFCVSQVIIDPTVQLGNFAQVYNSFCQNLRSPQSMDGSGIVNVLEKWAFKQFCIYQNVEGMEETSLNQEQINNFMTHLETEMVSVLNLEPSFARAVGSFAAGKVNKNSELSKYALDWIRGSDKIPSKEYSKQLGLKGKINGDDAYNFLKGVLMLTKEAGYAGTIVVLDEVETIRNIPNKSIRKKAYEIIRHILDDIGAGKFTCALFLITATPEFFTHRTGIKEYTALEERIRLIISEGGNRSNKQPILELLPLQKEHLFLLASKIRKIHGEAEGWDIMNRIPDPDLTSLAQYVSSGALGIQESEPRAFLKKLIECFDIVKEKPNKTTQDLIPKTGEADE